MKVVVISGPTATGKTDLAVELAKKFNGEIVNFDSLLLYKEIIIGTAKPTIEDQKEIPHHMIDVASIKHPLNAADYARQAFVIVEKLLTQKKIVFLVGGSGFYLQALLKGMYDSETTPIEIREKSDQLYEKNGIAPFLEVLDLNDPESFKRYHENDHYRIRRAVEHFWTTGEALSMARSRKDQENLALERPCVHAWEVLHIYLDIPKEQHLPIIERRTESMLSKGLISEVQDLLENGFTGEEKPLQSIGYMESVDFLQGRISGVNELKEKIIISTRQLAKAQRTWFNRDKFKVVLNPLEERPKIFLQVEKFIQS